MIKRTFDIIAAILGLIVCAPLFVLVAVVIKLDSPGPVCFRQSRMGKGFRRFYIYNFRTMIRDGSQKGGPLTTGKDLRITRVGRFLRLYKLNKLAQLINILRGDMSFVGPRPESPHYVQMYREGYEGILTVRPGLMDLASLRYINKPAFLEKAETTEMEYVKRVLPERIRLASIYIKQASFLFDLAIITQILFDRMGLRVVLLDLPELQRQPTKVDPIDGAKIRAIILKYRRAFIVTVDLGLITVANYLAFWLRFDGYIPAEQQSLFLQMLPWLVLIRGVTFSLFRLNEGLWRYTSIWDLQRIVSGVVTSTIAFYSLVHWGLGIPNYPRSIFIMDSILLVGFLVGVRLPARLFREKVLWRRKKRVLIYGAGDAGERIVREMKTHPSYQYEPLGFIDDQSSLVGQRIHGVKVLGTRQDLSRILTEDKPHEVLVAMPATKPEVIREIITALESFKMPIKTLPNLRDFLDDKSVVSQIRNLGLEDLLTRAPVGLKPQAVRHLIVGKRILVTGAGGSIGSELSRQIAEFQPDTLILYERHENSLYAMAKELDDRGHSSIVHPVIGDITDSARLHAAMAEYCPDIIFHAAAHKHVPLMELNPGEALKNNGFGTRIVAAAADHFGVERFILISTDKAVNPSSVMGATKRVAELVVQDVAGRSKTRFLTVRFGNVLGSNGSVVPLFREQIKAGGPVTVTHPAVRRYFMLIPEAVHLILQAAALGEQGAIYALEMGEQIKVLDLARNLIRLSGFVPGEEIPITFIGLRPGEKLYEELVGVGERAEPSSVDKIFRIQTGALPDLPVLAQRLMKFEQAGVLSSSTSVIERLQELVPGFQTPSRTGHSIFSAGTKTLEEATPYR